MENMNEIVQKKLGSLLLMVCEAELVMSQKDEEIKKLKEIIKEISEEKDS